MSNPLISVLIPAYKAQNSITTAINSVKQQSYHNWEVVVIVDGDFDNTFQVASEALQGCEGSRVIASEHTGVATKRNQLVAQARGDYIFFLDADDELRPNALFDLVTLALEDEADIVLGRTLRVSPSKHYERDRVIKSGINLLRKATFAEHPELVDSLGAANKLISAKIAKQNLFDATLHVAEDQPFNLGCYLMAQRISTTKRFTYLWKMPDAAGPGSLSTQIAKGNVDYFCDQLKALINGIERIESVLGPKATAISALVERVLIVDVIPSQRNFPVSDDKDAIRGFKALDEALATVGTYSLNEIALRALQELSLDLSLRQVLCGWSQARILHQLRIRILGIVDAQNGRVKFGKTINITFRSMKLKLPRRHVQRISTFTTGRITRYMQRPLLGAIVTLFAVHQNLNKVIKVLKTKSLKAIFTTLRAVYRLAPMQHSVIYVRTLGKISPDEIAIEKEVQQRSGLNFAAVTLPVGKIGSVAKTARLVATSRVIVVHDYCSALYGYNRREGQSIVQLWHASGAFKRFALAAGKQKDSNSESFERRAHSSYSHVVVSAPEIADHYAEAFGRPKESVIALGRASTDSIVQFHSDQQRVNDARENIGVPDGVKVLLYAPTFRGSPAERTTYWPTIDFVRLSQLLGPKWQIALRVHPVVKNVRLTAEETAVIVNASQLDLASAVAMADHVATDYSSIIFDAAAVGTPFSLFAPDQESYSLERGFFPEFLDLLPETPCRNVDELAQAVTSEETSHGQRLEDFRKFYVSAIDGNSTKRIVDLLVDLA